MIKSLQSAKVIETDVSHPFSFDFLIFELPIMNSSWGNVIGHQEQIEMLQRAAARGRLAHTYLFAGTRGIGKNKVARAFAQALLCDKFDFQHLHPCGTCKSCQLFLTSNHPDFLTVSKPAGKSEIPVDLFTGAKDDKLRPGLLAELSLRPQRSQKRVAIIDDADLMNDEGANALLKTLEEPPAYAVIILITSQLERVISTIRSRSQIICFGDLNPSDVLQILQQEGLESINDLELDSRLSTGLSVAQVLNLQEQNYQQVEQLLSTHLFSTHTDVVTLNQQLLEIIQAAGGDPASQRDHLRSIITQAVNRCRQLLCSEIESGSNNILYQETLIGWIERLASAEMDLDFAMAVPLCLESLCYDLANLKRQHQKV